MRRINDDSVSINGAGGYTSSNAMYPTHLTEPQGKIKKEDGVSPIDHSQGSYAEFFDETQV